MNVKQVLDQVFENVKFDKELYTKILYNNISLISNNDNKSLFGGQLMGCYMVKFTYRDTDIFFTDVLGMYFEEVEEQINKIRTIPHNFKIARDSINLCCFYIAHRFLSNPKLNEKEKLLYASEILNFFNYRTLITICSNFFIYPISEQEAITLFESLSGKYIIKQVKNWNEYCQYRTDEYLKNKFLQLLIKFNKDDEIPNAINDLFNRTKDMMKNLYRDFINLEENNEVLKQKKNIVNDIEGQEVMLDRLDTPDKYYNNIIATLTEKNNFIKPAYIDVVADILKNISYKQLNHSLNVFFEYIHTDHNKYKEALSLINNIIVNALDYIQKKKLFITDNTSILKVINMLVGNVLYARGEDVEINKLKEDLLDYVNKAHKHIDKKPLFNKSASNIRNGIFIYIFLRTFIRE